MINKAIDNLRYCIINRHIGWLREQLKWSDNNKIIGQIAYSIHNTVDFTDEAFRPFDDVNDYEAYILRELVEHTKNLENTLLPELESMSLDTRWFTEYYEELADVNNLLDDFNVL